MDVRYVFVTGGVSSSLGKGVCAASLALLLKEQGYRVNVIKLDPYLNISSGGLSPLQHGEIFITDDGAETDLDVGYYERFLNQPMCRDNQVTMGRIYQNVLDHEKALKYEGKTVQVIPHVTDEIKRLIANAAQDYEIVLIEIGGTVGDIESLPLLEAARQLKVDFKHVVVVHLVWILYLETSQEYKTKPAQHSMRTLQSIGIQADIMICRSTDLVTDKEKDKIALLCNLKNIINISNQKNIYNIPNILREAKVENLLLDQLGLEQKPAHVTPFIFHKQDEPAKNRIRIAIVGKYTDISDAYKSIGEAFLHVHMHTNTVIEVKHIDAEKIELVDLSTMDGIMVPGGFGGRGVAGKMHAVQYALDNNVPFFGICLGFQITALVLIRHFEKILANSTEWDKKSEHGAVDFISNDQYLRLGGHDIQLKKDSLAYSIYQKEKVRERHRHRYMAKMSYLSALEKHGVLVSGSSDVCAEIIEMPGHPWFFACQFHPEMTSNPRTGHPIFLSFVQACKAKQVNPSTF